MDVLSAPDGADLELWNGLKGWDVSDRIGFMRVGRRDQHGLAAEPHRNALLPGIERRAGIPLA